MCDKLLKLLMMGLIILIQNQKYKRRKSGIKRGTWNVRSLVQPIKLENAIQEMEYLMLQKDLEISWMDKISNDSVLERTEITANAKTGNNAKKNVIHRSHQEGRAGDLPLTIIKDRIEGIKRKRATNTKLDGRIL